MNQLVNHKGDYYLKTKNGWRKIISTTDSELWHLVKRNKYNTILKDSSKIFNIASIPQSFITHYVSEYNKGHVIKEVMVEYEEKRCGNTCTGCEEPEWCIDMQECEHEVMGGDAGRAKGDNFKFWQTTTLKLNSDGTCIIHPVEEKMYSRQQVETILLDYHIYSHLESSKFAKKYIGNWLDKHYPE